MSLFPQVDVDENEIVARHFQIRSMPTVLFIRPDPTEAPRGQLGVGLEDVKGMIQGGGAQFMMEFGKELQKNLTPEEFDALADFNNHDSADMVNESKALGLALTNEELIDMATSPLRSLSEDYVIKTTRADRGLTAVDEKLSFDVSVCVYVCMCVCAWVYVPTLRNIATGVRRQSMRKIGASC